MCRRQELDSGRRPTIPPRPSSLEHPPRPLRGSGRIVRSPPFRSSMASTSARRGGALARMMPDRDERLTSSRAGSPLVRAAMVESLSPAKHRARPLARSCWQFAGSTSPPRRLFRRFFARSANLPPDFRWQSTRRCASRATHLRRMPVGDRSRRLGRELEGQPVCRQHRPLHLARPSLSKALPAHRPGAPGEFTSRCRLGRVRGAAARDHFDIAPGARFRSPSFRLLVGVRPVDWKAPPLRRARGAAMPSHQSRLTGRRADGEAATDASLALAATSILLEPWAFQISRQPLAQAALARRGPSRPQRHACASRDRLKKPLITTGRPCRK